MNQMKFLAAILLLSACTASFAFDHVLVITIDTLRADHVGCNGSTKVKTPNIDALAARGVVFKNTVSPAPLTLPSHVSIFTGLIPPLHGVHDNEGFILDKKFTTLAEVFQSRGIRTAAFIGSFALDSRFGLAQGFDRYDDNYSSTAPQFGLPERTAEKVVNSALKWLQSETGPWFVWVHLYDPHFPYEPPASFQRMYPKDPYSGEIAYADQQVGRILDFLKKNSLEKTTLVVITSDHGESLGEHEEGTHGIFAYESTLRVPLIIAPLKPAVIQSRVRLIDVAPTIMDLQKMAFPGKVNGASLSNFIAGTKSESEDSYFQEMSMNLTSQWAPLRGFYSGKFKYISLPLPELYDLTKDPMEGNNLCSDKQLCNQWAERFAPFFKPFDNIRIEAAPIDSETAERLQALGYTTGHNAPATKKVYGPADDPKNLIRLHNREHEAIGLYRAGKKQQAIDILNAILQENPSFANAYHHAAKFENAGGSPQKAAEIMKRAIQNGIGGAAVESELGFYLNQAGNYQEAIQRLKTAAQRYPEYADIWNNLGLAYASSGSYDQADSSFQQALKLDPSNNQALTNMAMLYLNSQKYDQAIDLMKQALAVKPDQSHVLTALGIAYAQKQNLPEAIRTWEEAIRKDPKNFDAMWNLALAYQKRNPKRAQELLLEFQKTAPPAQYKQHMSEIPTLLKQLQ